MSCPQFQVNEFSARVTIPVWKLCIQVICISICCVWPPKLIEFMEYTSPVVSMLEKALVIHLLILYTSDPLSINAGNIACTSSGKGEFLGFWQCSENPSSMNFSNSDSHAILTAHSFPHVELLIFSSAHHAHSTHAAPWSLCSLCHLLLSILLSQLRDCTKSPGHWYCQSDLA